MQLIPLYRILEYLPHLVQLRVVVVLHEVRLCRAGVLDLLEAIVERYHRYGPVWLQGVVAVSPVKDACDTLRYGAVADETIPCNLVETTAGAVWEKQVSDSNLSGFA